MAGLCHYADLENAVDDAERLGRFAGLVDRHAGEGTLLTDAGDTLAPSLLGGETDGGHVPRVHETLGTDIATVGNHDLDHGVDALLSVVEASPATYLSANLAVDDTPLAASPGVTRVTRHRVDGLDVALTGVTTPSVADHPVDTGRLAADPVVPAVRDAFAGVDADRRVVVSHCGHADERIARDCDVDCVLGGHVHDHHVDRVGGTPVARPRPRGEHLLTVGLDQGVSVTTRSPGESPTAPAAVETARDLRAGTGVDEPVTTLDGSIPREGEALRPESGVGNLVADAFRAAAQADVALFDVGLLRAGPPLSGTVTVGDCRSLAPFDNEVHSTTLSGAELRRLLSDCPTVTDGDAVDAHFSGATVTYRHGPGGEWTLHAASVGGDPLADDRSYTVAAPSIVFHADGFRPLAVDRIEATHGHQHDAVETYLREAGPALADRVAPEGRIVVERVG